MKTAKKKWNFPCGARRFSRRDMLSTTFQGHFKVTQSKPLLQLSTCQGSWKLGIQQNVVTGDEDFSSSCWEFHLVLTCDFCDVQCSHSTCQDLVVKLEITGVEYEPLPCFIFLSLCLTPVESCSIARALPGYPRRHRGQLW